MKIKKIIVKNLFGLFNHEVPLNLDEHITIIHGPNGIGKTVLLSMLSAVFSSNYGKLRSIPFDELLICFDDNTILRLKKVAKAKDEVRKSGKGKTDLVFELIKNNEKLFYTVKSLIPEEVNFPLNILEEAIPNLRRLGQTEWLYLPNQDRLSLDEVLERFGDRLPYKGKQKGEQDWFVEIKKSISVHFIETQRLLRFSFSHRYRENERDSPVPAVIKYSEELAEMIQTKLAEYASLSQKLDRTFPTRIVKETGSSKLTLIELKKNFDEIEVKRSRLMAAGLLDKEKEIDLKDLLKKIDDSNLNVLSIYIEDVKNKLSIFDEFTNKIDLLLKIINSKFLYKSMSIGKREGFIFETSEGRKLSPDNLSSGEQHEVVLLYELLFKVSPNTLILIDEPELSLHVYWQQQFLKDLKNITELTGFDVLIATHSPQIIHDRWDLTVKLEGANHENLSDRS